MKQYRTLLVAPDIKGLNFATDEIRSVARGLDAFVLSEPVTWTDLIEAIKQQEYEILWFSCHSTEQGILLSDGHAVDASALVQLVRNTSAELVFINSCSSEMLGVYTNVETGADVVCTIRDVPDQVAYSTGVLFARHLSDGKSVLDAYNQAKPGNAPGQGRDMFRLFSHRFLEEKTEQVFSMDDVMKMLTFSNEQVRRGMEELKAMLQFELTKGREQNIRTRRLRSISWTLAYLMFGAFVLLGWPEVRGGMNLQTPHAIGTALVVFGVSYGMFFYGVFAE